MLYRMIEEESFDAVVKRLAQDPAYRLALTERLVARTVRTEILDRLIVYARGRQSTMGQAMARKVLTDAGVSWEAL
jgi:pyrroline-5-carboxylate reductase